MLAHNPRCLATWTNLPPRRYTNNVYHQAELVYPMLLAAADAEDGVRIFWRFPLLSWSRGMLDLLNRRPWRRSPSWTSELIVGNRTTMPRNCLSFGPRGAGNYFNEAVREAVRSAPKLRKFVLKACGINERVAPPTPRRAIYMPRRGAGLQSCMKSGCARNLVGWRSLVHEIERAFPATAPLVVVGTPGSSMTVCSQVALWASADILMTPNGAHFVNAPFMAAGSLLLEGVPWSMGGYIGQTLITRWSGVHHLRLRSSRPPSAPILGAYGRVKDEAACATNELCMRSYRDHSNIHVTPTALAELLAAASTELLGCVDKLRWKNRFGKTCADYATPMPPAAAKDGSLTAGGWCEAGRLKPSAQWAAGERYGWPERHCCACGGSSAGVGHRPTTKKLAAMS